MSSRIPTSTPVLQNTVAIGSSSEKNTVSASIQPASGVENSSSAALNRQTAQQKSLVAKAKFMSVEGTPKLTLPILDTTTLSATVRLAIKWAQKMETDALTNGAELTPDQRVIAEQMGVESPERVRVVVGKIPASSNVTLLLSMQKIGLISDTVNGLTFGHGIFIKDECKDDLAVLSHELRHVKQYEDFGAIPSFMKTYIEQVNEYGYRQSGLEQDAYEKQLNKE